MSSLARSLVFGVGMAGNAGGMLERWRLNILALLGLDAA